jgi:hypothetical protein
MSEEIIEQSGQDSGSSGENYSSDVALQERMMGGDSSHWFDDGIGAYMSPDGEPVTGKDGAYISTKEALQEYLKTTQNATNTVDQGQQQPATQPAANKVDSLFSTDAGKVSSVVNKMMNFDYTPSYTQKQVIDPGQQQGQQQQSVVEAKHDPKAEFGEYSNNLKANVLGPYEKAIAAMQRAGVYTSDNPEAIELSNTYAEAKRGIDDHLESKWRESIEKQFAEERETAKEKEQAAIVKAEADKSMGRVALDVGGMDTLEALLFGYEVQGKVQKGPGADLVNALFELAHSGKEIGDVNEAYRIWWPSVARNENLLRTITKYALAAYDVKNRSKDFANVRAQTRKDVQQQRKFVKQSPAATKAGSFGNNGGLPPEIARYAGMSTV